MFHGGGQFVRYSCWDAIKAQVALIATFSSSVLLGSVFLIFLLTIPSVFSMEFKSCQLAGQSSTVI